jgi:tRNA (cytidine/uridine-2'-O-)-methyltransferase
VRRFLIILPSEFFMKNSTDRPRTELKFIWPEQPLNIVLVEPEIPPNTGNIARLCAATGARLHLIEPLGFQLTSKAMKRAGLDYWDSVDVSRHANFEAFLETENPQRAFFFSTSGPKNYTDESFQPGDYFIFGPESKGLPLELLEKYSDHILNIPMQLDHVRSLNLSNCAAIVLYEALRQLNS